MWHDQSEALTQVWVVITMEFLHSFLRYHFKEKPVVALENVGRIYLFTSFSGHKPTQRECARMGLRSHAKCHPYPLPQPVKVCHTTGVYNPYSFRIVMVVPLHPTRTNE